MYFTKPLLSQAIKTFWNAKWVYDENWAFEKWYKIHCSRNEFAWKVDQIISSTNINEELVNLLRFPFSAEIIQEFATWKLNEKNINKFSLRIWFWKNNYMFESWDTFYWEREKIYSFCDNCLILFFEDNPLIIVGVDIVDNSLIIRQIQGIKWNTNYSESSLSDYGKLDWFDYEKSLIKTAEKLAKILWYTKVWIMSGMLNFNFRDKLIKFYDNYDLKAIEMWYAQVNEKGIYMKDI